MLAEPLIGIICQIPELSNQATSLSAFLNKPVVKGLPKAMDAGQFVLLVNDMGVSLQATGKKAAGPVIVDFMRGANAHRRQFGGGKGQMIAKAVGVKGVVRPHVLDVTAGLGQDAFVLASVGCRMSLVERSPLIFQLLSDGLERAQLSSDHTLQEVLSRITLSHHNGIHYLDAMSEPVDVIYLDPMFPEKLNKAEVNKGMKAFHALVGSDNDAGELLQAALQKARYRVVVKRPRKAPSISEQYPDLNLPAATLVFEGKSTRYDVYPLKKMP